MQIKLWLKIRYMVMLSNQIIYNIIEQVLSSILGDFVVEKHERLQNWNNN